MAPTPLPQATAEACREAADRVRAARLREALGVSGGNVTRAAEALGVSRGHAHRLLCRLGLGELVRRLRVGRASPPM